MCSCHYQFVHLLQNTFCTLTVNSNNSEVSAGCAMQAGSSPQDQVLCDLAHVYNCLTRREPQVGLPVPQHKEHVATSFVVAVQTLLDTRHFAKDHASEPPDPGVLVLESLH